jgi:hypothetical protein
LKIGNKFLIFKVKIWTAPRVPPILNLVQQLKKRSCPVPGQAVIAASRSEVKARNKEQGTRNKEQGTRNKEP